ncbi:MAG: S1 RNA-binding domain-containing protein [Myxococcales bacterium]|nr:S1 RNA-binding domain-containing protein [Myxococcales bacterium]
MEDTEKWIAQKSKRPIGTLVRGVVLKVAPFGVFVDVDGFEFSAVLLVTHFEDDGEGRAMDEYPQVGEVVSAVVVGFVEDTKQVRLSTRASDMVNGVRL